MDPSIPFTKAEMLQQLGRALLLYIRSTSWVLDGDAARRLVDWPAPPDHDALTNPFFTDFYEVAREEGRGLDLAKFSAYRIFADLYDYGVLGVLQSDIFPMDDATDATFPMAFVFDCADSQLLFEMQAGWFVPLQHCIQTARMSIARQVLDGGKRTLVPMDYEVPDGLLAIPEVALLANMEEGSVRNAASGKKTADSLPTVAREGKRYVEPKAALKWLRTRRGFRETQVKGYMVDFDPRTRAFRGGWEVVDFVRQRAETIDLTLEELADRVGLPKSAKSAEFRFQRLDDLCDPQVTRRLAELLGINERMLSLRLQECSAEERVTELRRVIDQARGEEQA